MLFWGYVVSIITSILVTLWVCFQKTDSPYWLLSPMLAPAILSLFITITRKKEIRDIIKSSNDTLLYSVSAIVAALLTLKTISLKSPDIFSTYMTNGWGYFMVSLYAILLVMKTSVALSELFENYRKLP